jgi:co-chaperonin GroES (HSP10)
MPATLMVHEEDPAELIWRRAGDAVANLEVFNNEVLVGVYVREAEGKTKGGIILTSKTTDEDRFQSKVGMILKQGPVAFQDTKNEPPVWFIGQENMGPGDWIVFRPSDGWNSTIVSFDVNGKKQELLCRWISDTAVRGRVADPDLIY